MARKEITPSVKTFADHEVITPPNELRKAVIAHPDPDDDPVARAEAALAQLSGEFAEWMAAECERLESARRELKRVGFGKKTLEDLYRASHDIRGEAATFGFAEAAPVADSLCRLLEHSPDPQRIPVALIEQHVDAIRAITRERDRPELVMIAATLARRLREVTDEFLRVENSDRPDYLAAIFAPPLAP
jgi:HPt (histidine-containing phosphotransfer) domain-containing protein